jgi:hypothetical protein
VREGGGDESMRVRVAIRSEEEHQREGASPISLEH